MRWRVAYYVLVGMVGKLIDAVDNTTNNNVFKAPHVFLHFSHNMLVAFLMW
jgi:hypothetical protein